MNNQRKLTASFKARVALEAIRERRTDTELAKRYRVDRKLIALWKREAIKNLATIFEKKRPKRRAADADKQPGARGRAVAETPDAVARSMRMLEHSYRPPPEAKTV